ncbi:MAG: GDSL-type esterase/lipase family protein [bacterium]|nr:GDSL-type esterase/lipase family protein [bacterium]
MIYKGVYLHNVAELLKTEDGIMLTRIPDSLRMSLSTWIQTRAIRPAGVELRFNLKSNSARIILKSQEEGIFVSEVYQGNFLVKYCYISNNDSEIVISLPQNIEQLKEISKKKKLPFDAGLTRIILPWGPTCVIKDIEGEFEPPMKEQLPAIRYLAYGSSITQGESAINPSGTYAMKTAYLLGLDLINLGFGSGARCEKEMADYIAGRNDWAFATLEMGINMFYDVMSVSEFRKRVEYFVPTIVKAHPDKYVFCIDMFTFNLGRKGEKKRQKEYRDIVKEVATAMNSEKVIHIDGRKLLKSWSGLCRDLVHPSPAGMEEIARNLSGIIKRYIKYK